MVQDLVATLGDSPSPRNKRSAARAVPVRLRLQPSTTWVTFDATDTNHYTKIWVFPKLGVPRNERFIMENPIKMDDFGVPLFLETPISKSNSSSAKKSTRSCWTNVLQVVQPSSVQDSCSNSFLGPNIGATRVAERSQTRSFYMDVSPKIGGKPPKWMVKIMENPIKIKMDDLGYHYFWKHPYETQRCEIFTFDFVSTLKSWKFEVWYAPKISSAAFTASLATG